MDWTSLDTLKGFIGGCLTTVVLLVVAWIGTIVYLARADRKAQPRASRGRP